jgi:hypothetical protein
MKELRAGDEISFWYYLAKNHYFLYTMLKDAPVAPGDVICIQPPGMSDTDYELYKGILKKWLMDNEFM